MKTRIVPFSELARTNNWSAARHVYTRQEHDAAVIADREAKIAELRQRITTYEAAIAEQPTLSDDEAYRRFEATRQRKR